MKSPRCSWRISASFTSLAEADQLRLRYIAGLLEDCGCSARDAKARAVLAYAFIRVGTTLIEDGDQSTIETCFSFLTNVG